MPRTARASQGGLCYHVINRGNARQDVFHKKRDFDAFLKLLELACQKRPMRVLSYCLMPNHFHLALWPYHDGDLGRFMQWLLTSHVRRYHRHYGSSGHVWQGRFKAFPIQQDEHLLTVLRYIERNALRAKLVRAAESWQWSSAARWISGAEKGFLHAGPVSRGKDWLPWVNKPVSEEDLRTIRESINRGRPFGSHRWVQRTATRLGLTSTLRPRGRPRKRLKK
jgi:putative transposase